MILVNFLLNLAISSLLLILLDGWSNRLNFFYPTPSSGFDQVGHDCKLFVIGVVCLDVPSFNCCVDALVGVRPHVCQLCICINTRIKLWKSSMTIGFLLDNKINCFILLSNMRMFALIRPYGVDIPTDICLLHSEIVSHSSQPHFRCDRSSFNVNA